jgi:hypothetical protein
VSSFAAERISHGPSVLPSFVLGGGIVSRRD